MHRPLKYCLALLVAACFAAGHSAFGGIVFFDDFNKTPDQPLAGTVPNTGGAWAAISAAGTNAIQIKSGAAALGAAGGEDTSSLTDAYVPTTVGNPIHTGLDLTVTSATTAGDYFAHLGDGSTTVFFQRLFAKSTTGGYLLGLTGTSGGTIVYGTTVLALGTPVHVDINWTPVAGNSNDSFAVLVNSAAYLTHTWDSATVEPALIKSAHLRQGGASSSAALSVDNYVVDAPTTIPVPEPATMMMLGLALAGLGCGRSANRRSR